jgi:catechol 2,3-dioxygenase-like lactoylglutathione lyase family enzyme
MKRFHVHLAVDDLAANIRFYSTVFGMPPSVEKTDYAKWMLDDPRINFAVSSRGMKPGVDHLGVQVDSDDDLAVLRENVAKADIAALDQTGAACCYARSDKYWVTDPQGIAWETFRTLDSIPTFGTDVGTRDAGACCAPQQDASACCAPQAQGSSFVQRAAQKTSCC